MKKFGKLRTRKEKKSSFLSFVCPRRVPISVSLFVPRVDFRGCMPRFPLKPNLDKKNALFKTPTQSILTAVQQKNFISVAYAKKSILWFSQPNQFGLLIKVVAEVVEGNFRKSHYFPQNLLNFLVVTEDFLTKVVGRAVIFNQKKSLQKIFQKKLLVESLFST